MKFNKRRKRIFLLLLLSVIGLGIGIGFGSLAYFIKTQILKSNLHLKTGTLKMQVIDEEKWDLQNKSESQVINKYDSNDFKNVKPGDSFVKKVKIKNVGTLIQRIELVENANLPLEVSKYFDVDIETTEIFFSRPNQIQEIYIKMTLKENTDFGINKKNIDLSNIENFNIITIKATQIFGSVDIFKLKAEPREGEVTSGLNIALDYTENKFVTSSRDYIAHYRYSKEYMFFHLIDKNGKTKSYINMVGLDDCKKFSKKINGVHFDIGDTLEVMCKEPENLYVSLGGSNYKPHQWRKALYIITEHGLKFSRYI